MEPALCALVWYTALYQKSTGHTLLVKTGTSPAASDAGIFTLQRKNVIQFDDMPDICYALCTQLNAASFQKSMNQSNNRESSRFAHHVFLHFASPPFSALKPELFFCLYGAPPKSTCARFFSICRCSYRNRQESISQTCALWPTRHLSVSPSLDTRQKKVYCLSSVRFPLFCHDWIGRWHHFSSLSVLLLFLSAEVQYIHGVHDRWEGVGR